MPTLDTTIQTKANVNLTVKYHSSKVPTDLQLKRLADALEEAKRITTFAMNEIATILRTKTTSATTRDILVYHFHFAPLNSNTLDKTWETDLKKAQGVLKATYHGMSSPMTISDSYSEILQGEANPSRGYVSRKRAALNVNGKVKPDQLCSVHLNFDILADTKQNPKIAIARTIVHESTHKFKDTEDHAYAWYHPESGVSENARYKNLTKDQALDNADSYAYTVVSLVQKQVVTKMVDNIQY